MRPAAAGEGAAERGGRQQRPRGGHGWRSRIQRFLGGLNNPSPDTLVATVEFSYQHYALGDALTAQVTTCAKALDAGLRYIDLLLAVDPREPSSRYQPFITAENYLLHLEALYPAFLCNPMLRSIRLLRDQQSASHAFLSSLRSGVPVWPSVRTQLTRRFDYPLDHDDINGFFAKHGYIPHLAVPRGYERWVDRYLSEARRDRVIVSVNIRQSSLSAASAELSRDAVLEIWHDFLAGTAKEQPDVLFFLLGGFAESDHRLLALPNVTTPRTIGLGLGHELAILLRSDLFIGSSSGFSAAATFSDVPYLILNVQNSFAPYAGLSVGDSRYPFARADQLLTWERETFDDLRSFLRRFLSERPDRSHRSAVECTSQ